MSNTTNQIKKTVIPCVLAWNHSIMIFAMLIALATSLATAQTAPLKEWDARFGGSGYDASYSLQQTADGGYIMGGESSSGISGDKTQANQGVKDFWIVKTDANGVKQWDARFGGSGIDLIISLQQTADGGYILGGWSNSGISGDKTQASQGGYDYWIVKTDANGVKQWDKRFGGSSDDWFYSLQQTADGGYILGGHSHSGISGDKTQASQGDADYWIVKTDANGVKQWDARFGTNNYDPSLSVRQTADGGYILGGVSASGINGDKTQANQGGYDYWMVKTDANGVKQWDATFGGSSDELFYSLQQTADGGYILGGRSLSGISGDKTQASRGAYDYWIVKTDANGVKQWDARFGGSQDDLLYTFQQTADEGYLLGGFSLSGISGDKTQASRGGFDYWIVKTDANGVKEWDERFGGSNDDQLLSLQQTADGGYSLGGASLSGISGDKTQASQGSNDFWIVKVASECNGGSTVYADVDGDAYGDIANSLFAEDCIAPGGYVYNSTDCNDANASIYPGALEVTNGIDDNCNGIIDDVVCPVPTNLSVTNITSSSAKIKWNTVADAKRYKLRYKITGTSTWTTLSNISSTSKTISGLAASTSYTCQVKSVCSANPIGSSGWSSSQTFTTGSLRMGDESLQQVSLQIYPSPTTGKFTIELTLPKATHDATVQLISILGPIVFNEKVEATNGMLQKEIQLKDDLANGMYLVQVIAGDQVYASQLMHQK